VVNKPMIGVAAAVVLVAAGAWFVLHQRNAALPVVVAPQPAPEQTAENAIVHPLPGAADDALSKTPLPSLNDSDAAISEALSQVAGSGAVKDYLVPQEIIRRLVVTIDNMPRQKIAVDKRPTVPISGTFLANGDELHSTLDPRNFARYEPMVAVVRNISVPQLTAVYVHFYPLMQQAYQSLGYPNAYFNDRLVQVIDLLLATPQPSGPIDLVRPNVMYQFADSALESKPAGQKLLLRMGPENAAVIKAKLIELRAAITAASLKR
jgi:Protein of unknown function (DUF3014)